MCPVRGHHLRKLFNMKIYPTNNFNAKISRFTVYVVATLAWSVTVGSRKRAHYELPTDPSVLPFAKVHLFETAPT